MKRSGPSIRGTHILSQKELAVPLEAECPHRWDSSARASKKVSIQICPFQGRCRRRQHINGYDLMALFGKSARSSYSPTSGSSGKRRTVSPLKLVQPITMSCAGPLPSLNSAICLLVAKPAVLSLWQKHSYRPDMLFDHSVISSLLGIATGFEQHLDEKAAGPKASFFHCPDFAGIFIAHFFSLLFCLG